MMKVRSLFLALFITAIGTGSAFADTFNFSFSGSTFSGSGQLNALNTGSGIFTIESASGTVDTGVGGNKSISLLAPNSFQGNDNILYYPSSANTSNPNAFFDLDGVSFLLSNGAEVNLFLRDGAILMRAGGNYVGEVASISVTATPEPSTFLLLGTGLGAGLIVVRRKAVFA
jgi:hypothetical protein